MAAARGAAWRAALVVEASRQARLRPRAGARRSSTTRRRWRAAGCSTGAPPPRSRAARRREEHAALVARHLARAGPRRRGRARLRAARPTARAPSTRTPTPSGTAARRSPSATPSRPRCRRAIGDAPDARWATTAARSRATRRRRPRRPRSSRRARAAPRRACTGRRGEWELAEARLAAALEARLDGRGGARADDGRAQPRPLHERGDRERGDAAARRRARAGRGGRRRRRARTGAEHPRHAGRGRGDLDAAGGHLERQRGARRRAGRRAHAGGRAEQPRPGAWPRPATSSGALELTRTALELCVALRATATARPRSANQPAPTCSTTPAAPRTRWGSSSGRSPSSPRSARTRKPQPEIWKLVAW